jgi:hypothetical protein
MPLVYLGTGWFIGIALASALRLPIEVLLPASLVPIVGLFLLAARSPRATDLVQRHRYNSRRALVHPAQPSLLRGILLGIDAGLPASVQEDFRVRALHT